MRLPSKLQAYNCDDYLASPIADQGFWDESGQIWYFLPLKDIYEHTDKQFLVVGSAGVDGIEWGYRKGCDGLWAYYPIEQTFKFLASTFQELVDGWLSGNIKI